MMVRGFQKHNQVILRNVCGTIRKIAASLLVLFFFSFVLFSRLYGDAGAQREIENNQKKSEENVREVQVHLFNPIWCSTFQSKLTQSNMAIVVSSLSICV